MRFASYNICIKIDNTRLVTKFLEEQNADIVVLQEAVRSLDENVFKEYCSENEIVSALKKGNPYSFFAPMWVSDGFVKNDIVYRDFGGMVEQGNLTLSRFPIVDGACRFYYLEYRLWKDTSRFREGFDHGRAFAVTQHEVNGSRLKVINVHGTWNRDRVDSERTIRQSELILAEALKDDMAVIIAGDFNLTPDTKSIKMIDKHFRNLSVEHGLKNTRTDDKEPKVIDYLFVNDKVEVKSFEAVKMDASDHLPLLMEFEL